MKLLNIPSKTHKKKAEQIAEEKQLKKEKKIKLWKNGTLEIKEILVNDKPLSQNAVKGLYLKNKIKLFRLNCCGIMVFTREVFVHSCGAENTGNDRCKVYIEMDSQFRLIKEETINDNYWNKHTKWYANRKEPYFFGESGIEKYTDIGRMMKLVPISQGTVNRKELSQQLNDISIFSPIQDDNKTHIYKAELKLSTDLTKEIGVARSDRSLFICTLQPFQVLRILQQHNLDAPLEKKTELIKHDPFFAKIMIVPKEETFTTFEGPRYYGEDDAIILDSEGNYAMAITQENKVLKFIPHWSFFGPHQNFEKIKSVDFDCYLREV